MLPSLTDMDESAADGTIFQKLMSLYHDTATHAQDMIVQLISTEVESGLRAHHAVMSNK